MRWPRKQALTGGGIALLLLCSQALSGCAGLFAAVELVALVGSAALPEHKKRPVRSAPKPEVRMVPKAYTGPLCEDGRVPIARCHDGSYSCAHHVSLACREQGGVHLWI